jgi:hypothetical protein
VPQAAIRGKAAAKAAKVPSDFIYVYLNKIIQNFAKYREFSRITHKTARKKPHAEQKAGAIFAKVRKKGVFCGLNLVYIIRYVR